jgi:hypothetical protein
MTQILLSVLTPAVVWLAVWIVRAVKPVLPVAVITTLIVPALSALAAWVGTVIVPGAPWEVTLLIGLASTFIHEFLNNLKNTVMALGTQSEVPKTGVQPDTQASMLRT